MEEEEGEGPYMSNRNVIVGMDLDRKNPQICYYETGSGDTQTAPMKNGVGEDSIEAVLDALEKRVRERSLSEEALHDLQDRGAALLRQSFRAHGIDDPEERIAGITITAEQLTRPFVSLVRGIYYRLGLDRERAFVQDHKESFYYHTMVQDPALWQRNVGFFRFSDRDVTFYSMGMDTMARPITVSIEQGITIHLAEERRRWDEQFYNMANASLRQNMYTSIFLMGDTFDKSWAGRSISLLCKGGRKVFVVDNLFARGACFAAREKVEGKRLGDYLYVSGDLVRSNIGMEMSIQGLDTYYPLISAGVNWYETEKECECLLTDKPELIFVISSADHEKTQLSRMQLPGMPHRPPKTTRIRLRMMYTAPGKCAIEVEDLGFGELFPSSGKVWHEIWEDKR